MRLAIKAALLSGLVYPGLGQLVLKHYARGIAFMIVSLVSMILVVIQLTRQATLALERLAVKGGPVDIGNLSEAASHTVQSSSLRIVPLLILMLGCWVVAAVDAYRLGRQKDLMASVVFEIPDDRSL